MFYIGPLSEGLLKVNYMCKKDYSIAESKQIHIRREELIRN